MGVNENEAILEKAEQGPSLPEIENIHRLGWDDLTIEQKVERMRAIVKGIDAKSHEHWRRLEELGHQMRHHSHGNILGPVLIPLDTKEPGYGATAKAQMPGGKIYF